MTKPDLRVTGVDLAPNMLAYARRLIHEEGLEERVRLIEADIRDLPVELLRPRVDAVSCLWTLHHLPDDAALSAALQHVAALRSRHRCAVWILDFQRLNNEASFSRVAVHVDVRKSELRVDGCRHVVALTANPLW